MRLDNKTLKTLSKSNCNRKRLKMKMKRRKVEFVSFVILLQLFSEALNFLTFCWPSLFLLPRLVMVNLAQVGVAFFGINMFAHRLTVRF